MLHFFPPPFWYALSYFFKGHSDGPRTGVQPTTEEEGREFRAHSAPVTGELELKLRKGSSEEVMGAGENGQVESWGFTGPL